MFREAEGLVSRLEAAWEGEAGEGLQLERVPADGPALLCSCCFFAL